MPVEPPIFVVNPDEPVVPISPIIDETVIGEIVIGIDPSLINIDLGYPGITVGYDPVFHGHWLWMCDDTDFAIEDGGLVLVRGFDFDGEILPVADATLFSTMTGQSVFTMAGQPVAWKTDAGALLGAVAVTAGSEAGVPEPLTAVLGCLGLLGLAGMRRRG